MTTRDKNLRETIHETVVDIISWFVNNKNEESYYVTECLTKLARWVEDNPSSNLWTEIETPDDLPEEGKIVLGVVMIPDKDYNPTYKRVLCQWKHSGRTEFGEWYDTDGNPTCRMRAWAPIPEYDPMYLYNYNDDTYNRPAPL